MSLLDIDPSELIGKLGDKAESEFASKGEGWLDDLLGEGRKIATDELDSDALEGALDGLDVLEAGKQPFLRLSEHGLARIVGYLGSDEEEKAKNVYLATQATFAERRAAMHAAGDAAQQDREERDAAWAEVQEVLKKVGAIALKVIVKALVGALAL